MFLQRRALAHAALASLAFLAPRLMGPQIRRRAREHGPVDWPQDMHPLLAHLYAARGVHDPLQVQHRLANLLAPHALGGIDTACELLHRCIREGRRIVVVGDYDCDGATGCAVAVRGLRMLGATAVDFVVPHRFRHGYGLSTALVETLAPAPDLIVTVDNGIASLDGVQAARARGIEVLITDHHLPGKRLPDANAIVNPNLDDDPFPSKALAGVGVMFYLLLALRSDMRTAGRWNEDTQPDLARLLDLVALGTVADMVPLDRNNRTLVAAGLRRMRANRACAGIRALIDVSGRCARTLTAPDLGFALGPRLNAAGRLQDMRVGIECLLSDDDEHARGLAEQLSVINAERRVRQADMVAEAEVMASAITHVDAVGVVLYEPSWHAGIVGLVASRLKDRLHRPIVAFAPASEDSESPEDLRGSARSVPELHMRDALAEVDVLHPGLITRFGGHAMAAGLSLPALNYDTFAAAFDLVARRHLGAQPAAPVLWTDGELAAEDFCLHTARLLRDAGPWGQGFPEPLFDNIFDCLRWRRMGAAHWRLDLRLAAAGDTHRIEAVMFNAGSGTPPDRMRAVYQLGVDDWQGTERLRLLLRHVEPV